MKTITDTPDTLIMEDKPWGLGLIIIAATLVFFGVGVAIAAAGEIVGGLAFVVGGIAMGTISLWAFVRQTQLWIDAGAGRVALRSRNVFGFVETTWPLGDLERAETQRSTSSKGQVQYRPVLVFGGETHATVPVIDVYFSGRSAGVTANAINTWLSRRS
jgi:hypothetical protein